MKISSLVAALVTLALTTAPAWSAPTASPSAASALSLPAGARVGAPPGKSKLAEGGAGIFALLIGAGIAAIVIVAAVNDDNSDSN